MSGIERVATPLKEVDLKPLVDAVERIKTQEELERLQGIKRTLDKYITENDRALLAKSVDITVIDGMDEDDLPSYENLLEWMDYSLSQNDLKKKSALLNTDLRNVKTAIAKLEEQKLALGMNEPANLISLRDAEKAEFTHVLESMPPEMHLLKVLNNLGEYEDLNSLIEQYAVLAKDSPDAYAEYIVEMTRRVDNVTRSVALHAMLSGETGSTTVSHNARTALIHEPAAPFKKLEEEIGLIASTKSFFSNLFGKSDVEKAVDAGRELDKEIKFANLSPEIQQEIINQRAFILKLQAYLSYTTLDRGDPLYVQLDNYYRQLQTNVTNSLLNEKDLTRAREDFELIKADIALRESEIAGKVFGNNFYTGTNAKAGALVAGGVTSVMFLGTIGAPVAAALALAAMGGFYKDSVQQAKAVADYNVANNNELINDNVDDLTANANLEDSKMRPVEYYYIQKLDNIFKVKTGKDNIPIVEQTVTGQLKGAGSGAYTAAKESANQARSALQNKILDILNKRYPRLAKLFNKLLENWRDMNIRRTIMLSVGVMGGIFITALIPPLWPICIGLILACAAIVIAWRLGVPVTKFANKLFDMAGSVVAGISNVINFVLKPLRTLDFKGQRYGRRELLWRLTVSGLCAVAGGLLVASLAPAAGLLIGLGAISGMYIGLTVSEVFKNLFVKPVQLSNQAANISQMIESQDFSLREEQSLILNSLYKNFDKIVLNHFKARHDELAARIAFAQKQIPSNPEAINKIGQDLYLMENGWMSFKEAVNTKDAARICEVLTNSLRTEYLSQRESLVQEPAQYKERARKQMSFSTQNKDTPVGAVPEFRMEFAVDFAGERAKMQELEQMMAVVQTIETSNKKSPNI